MATISLAPDPNDYQLRRRTKASNTVVITNAGGANATSDVIDKRGMGLIGIILPTLTSTTLSVEVSDSAAGTYQPLYTRGGTQVSWATETGAKAYDIPELSSFNFFRLKSSVQQASDRTITIQGHV